MAVSASVYAAAAAAAVAVVLIVVVVVEGRGNTTTTTTAPPHAMPLDKALVDVLFIPIDSEDKVTVPLEVMTRTPSPRPHRHARAAPSPPPVVVNLRLHNYKFLPLDGDSATPLGHPYRIVISATGHTTIEEFDGRGDVTHPFGSLMNTWSVGSNPGTGTLTLGVPDHLVSNPFTVNSTQERLVPLSFKKDAHTNLCPSGCLQLNPSLWRTREGITVHLDLKGHRNYSDLCPFHCDERARRHTREVEYKEDEEEEGYVSAIVNSFSATGLWLKVVSDQIVGVLFTLTGSITYYLLHLVGLGHVITTGEIVGVLWAIYDVKLVFIKWLVDEGYFL